MNLTKVAYGYDDIILKPTDTYAPALGMNLPSRNSMLHSFFSERKDYKYAIPDSELYEPSNTIRLVNSPMTVFTYTGIAQMIKSEYLPFVFIPRMDFWPNEDYSYEGNNKYKRIHSLLKLQEYYPNTKIVPSFSLREIQDAIDGNNINLLLLLSELDLILIDIAWLNTNRHFRILNQLEKMMPKLEVITGNTGNLELAKQVAIAHPNVRGIRIGIGSGSACLTKINTASGNGSVNAFLEGNVIDYKREEILKERDVMFIADGGIRHSGDYIKALALGATHVMSGKMIAKCSNISTSDEYIGLASEKNRKGSSEISSSNSVEGTHFKLNKSDKSLQDLIYGMHDNLVTAMLMQNVSSLDDFQKYSKIMLASSSTFREAMPNPE